VSGCAPHEQSILSRLAITEFERHWRDAKEHHEHFYIQEGWFQFLKVSQKLLKKLFRHLNFFEKKKHSHMLTFLIKSREISFQRKINDFSAILCNLFCGGEKHEEFKE
jgi:hypothetical protein